MTVNQTKISQTCKLVIRQKLIPIHWSVVYFTLNDYNIIVSWVEGRSLWLSVLDCETSHILILED